MPAYVYENNDPEHMSRVERCRARWEFAGPLEGTQDFAFMNTPTGCILAPVITHEEDGSWEIDHTRWRDYPGFHVVSIMFKGPGGVGRQEDFFFEALEV